MRAGADLLLYGPDEAPAQRAYSQLLAGATAGRLAREKVLADAQRIVAFKQQKAAAAQVPVAVGLERLDAPEAAVLQGKRVGLIANAASVTHDGTTAWRALQAGGIDVRRLFSPEHGISGQAGAGERLGNSRVDGLPVVSLYGDHLQPTTQDLKGLDALVFDLQEAGVRFYTYASTELLALQAAAKAGIPFVVLDRPDPLGGARVEGPLVARGPDLRVARARAA